jgi:hypothetical protein
MEGLQAKVCPITGVVRVWSPCGLELFIARTESRMGPSDPKHVVELRMRGGEALAGESSNGEYAYVRMGIGAQGDLDPTGMPPLVAANGQGWEPPVLEAEIPLEEDPSKWTFAVAPSDRDLSLDLVVRHNRDLSGVGEVAEVWTEDGHSPLVVVRETEGVRYVSRCFPMGEQ